VLALDPPRPAADPAVADGPGEEEGSTAPGGAPAAAAPAPPAEEGRTTAAADEPLAVSGDVVPPELIDGPPPEYTQLARRARLQGVVVVRAVIDETGVVREATVLKGLPMGLNEAAVAAVRRWRYRPATLGGRPVTVSYNVAVNFRLQ
ncbi:MAG TPA: energy transducer TonB, partial [Thermoanaerobaculia bacterium]|nr:energy transducer TonB [Thermoanaerobaculia bacterium]